MVKALSLFSGGLDSLLAVKVLEAQGIEVVGICFVSNFYDAKKARVIAKKNNIKLIVVDFKDTMLALVKEPLHGYGKNLNPCIDCHSTMIKEAGRIAKQEGFDFIATGEVLGQRPFSQNGEALLRVKHLAGVDVLRPLSAKLLPETEAEKLGLVKREELLDIEGRSRERQQALLEKFKIEVFETPGGGCVLTDSVFCDRLSQVFEHWPECEPSDVDLIRAGRTFWLSLGADKALLTIGRHQEDNVRLKELVQEGDFMLELKQMTGPLAILRFKNIEFDCSDEERVLLIPDKIDFKDTKFAFIDFNNLIDQAGIMTAYYATRARGESCVVKIIKV